MCRFKSDDEIRITIDRLDRARCPECGRRIIAPGWQEQKDGTFYNPYVVCRDMGHWCGYLSDCAVSVIIEGDHD